MNDEQSDLDRREFIKMSAVGAEALAAGSTVLPVGGADHQVLAQETLNQGKSHANSKQGQYGGDDGVQFQTHRSLT